MELSSAVRENRRLTAYRIRNKMIDIKIPTKDNINELMNSRLEMLKVVNDLPEDYEYSEEIINESRDYFLNGDHLTVLAMDDDVVIGCASMSFIRIMPTFEHPTGKRAHLMNVYTRETMLSESIVEELCKVIIYDAKLYRKSMEDYPGECSRNNK